MRGTDYIATEMREPPVSGTGLALFLLFLSLLYFSALGTMPLMEPDEGRYAEIPREMLASGDFVTPRLNGVVYIEKPPLHYWGSAAGQAVFGRNEFGARFFGASVALLGVLLTGWMGSALGGPRTGLYSAAVLATSLYHYIVGRINATDMTVGVMLVLAIFPSYLYLSGKRASRGWLWLGFAGAALAFLAKGLIGVVFPAAILFLWALFAGRPKAILKLFSPVGIAIFLAIALPWVLLVQEKNPDFLQFFFVREHFQRFTDERVHHRGAPFWYFLPIVAAGLMPWPMFAWPLAQAYRARASRFLLREDRIFLLTWILFVLGFFSISSSKLATYMTPLFPPLAVLLGRGLSLWADREEGIAPVRAPFVLSLLMAAAILVASRFGRTPIPAAEWIPLALPSALLALGFGAAPLFARRLGGHRTILLTFVLLGLFLASLNRPTAALVAENRSGRSLARAIEAEGLRPEDVVAQYGTYVQSVPYYLARRNVLVGDPGELEFGMLRAPDRADWFLSDEAFGRLWRSDRRVFCIFNRDSMPLIREKFPDHRLLARSRRGILIVNR